MLHVEEIGKLPKTRLFVPDGKWVMNELSDRYYETLHPSYQDIEDMIRDISFDGPIVQQFLIRLPPGGFLHKHVDRRKPGWVTYHIPIETNWRSMTVFGDKEYQMEVGKLYRIQRDVEHWAYNWGETPRTHLLIEVDHGYH